MEGNSNEAKNENNSKIIEPLKDKAESLNKDINKEHHFVYFIESHDKSKQIKISLSPEYKNNDTLELIQKKDNSEIKNLIYNIYRFKIFPDNYDKNKKFYEINLLLEENKDENQSNKVESILQIYDIKKDFYDYNFYNEKINIIKLSNEQKFQIYIDYLKSLKIKQGSKENEEFILSTQLLIAGKDKGYTFLFYLLIFLECYTTKLVHRHLLSFKPEKIKGLGKVSNIRQKQMSNILNFIAKKPEKIRVEKEESRKRITEQFYFIVLYYNINFEKDKVNDMLNDEKILDYVYKNIFKYKEKFENLIISVELDCKLLDKAEDYNQVLICLTFLGRDFLYFLKVINKKSDLILKFISKEEKKDENNENKIYIEAEKYVQPKPDDNLEKILNEINELKKYGMNTHKMLVKFTPDFVDRYIEYNQDNNINNLISLNHIIISIKSMDKNFKCNKKMDSIIHETGLNLVRNGYLKNNKLLEFIKKDDFFLNKAYKSPLYRPLYIFDGIDISNLDDEFYNNWKTMKLNEMFENNFNEFILKISSLVKEMKDFNILIKLFSYNENNNIAYQYTIALHKRFIELFDTYSKEKCPNFINDVVELIILSDKKNVNLKKFLIEHIQKNYNLDVVNGIYITLTEKYENLSRDIIKIIIDFFLKDKTNSQPLSLVNLIEKCKKIRHYIFSELNKYIISEEDIFNYEETDNYKFFNGLLEKNLFDIKNEKNSTYIIKSLETISSLQNAIKKYEINLGSISIFFRDSKDRIGESILFKRLLVIYLLDGEKTKYAFDSLKEKIEDTNKKIKQLEIIYNDFNNFFNQLHKNEIYQLLTIIPDLKTGKLNCLEKKYSQEYNKYLKYYDNAQNRLKLSESIIFNVIYQDLKNQKYEDDKKLIEKTEKKFNEVKHIFDKNGIEKLDKDLLELCVKPFQNNNNDLNKEINKLVEIFEIKEKDVNDEIYNKLLILSKREYIFNIASSINCFIKILKSKETEFTKDLKKIIESLQNLNDINKINKCKETLDKYDINILDKENNIYIDILIKLKIQEKAIELLLKTSIEECRHLQELCGESDNNFISVNDILDMEKCIEFLKKAKITKDSNKQNDIDIIKSIKENASKNKNILLHFEKYIANYSQINLLTTSSNKSEVLKYQIQEILNGAEFILSNAKDTSFECTYDSKEVEGNKKILEKENIINLKERAQIAKIITSQYKYFIQNIKEILHIYHVLKNIYVKGYPKIIIVKIILKINKKDNEKDEYNSNNKYYIDNIDKKNYIEIIDILKNILIDLEKEQTKAYEEKNLIRFIYGRQFNLLYNYFQDKNKDKNDDKIIHLLKYITNDLYKKKIKHFNYEEKDDIIKTNISNCEKFLNEILNINDLKLDNIYKNTLIKKNIKKEYKGLYTFLCEKLEKDLFQIFKYLTRNNPIAQNILLCNKNTTNEEITTFLYRAIKCDYNSCFIFGGSELLNYDQKTLIIKLLDDFLKRKNHKMKSCLIFIHTNPNSDIYKSLIMKGYRETLDIKKKNFEDEKYEGNDIEIVRSDKSGVGKSTQIKKDIVDNKKKWLYFPIGGEFTREDIIKRLKEKKIDNNCVLHLDLYDTDQISLMLDFLFSLLITRFYGQSEDIFYLSKDVEIKIELPNSFINFYEKFPILTLFPTKEIKISKLPSLIVPNELDSNIQIVANYLKSLKEKKIDKFDLIFPNITPSDFKNHIIYDKKNKEKINPSIDAKKITSVECQKLIFDVIKEQIPNPTYYQIITFINVLAVQLKKLNINYYLNAYELILSRKNINDIRTFIVESFIKITKHFTEGAFTNLIKGQEKVHKSLCGIYDEGKDINNAINDLANAQHEVISFDKIDPSLLFFHEGDGESFSIITNKNPKDKEYIDLLKLKNYQSTKKDYLKLLPKYNSPEFDKYKFLEELKDILDIKNPVKKGTKSEYKSLEEIAKNYVFTADNFVKMVLILLRIRSNIPVIMMGETGCGKTSLIRKLSEMKNNGNADKMKILNIHAGTNDNDIINFINEKVIPETIKMNNENKTEKEKRKKLNLLFEEHKIWVFLDEINTCKSMGLISELMCKHSCQGKPLPSNIVFIAACNPYRQREIKGNKENNQVGLDINFANQQKKLLNDKEKQEIAKAKNNNLVYTVNPLPHSLLNFVFDFGSLTQKDEENYIRCIIKEAIEKIYYKNKENQKEDEKIKKLKKLAGDMIIEAHNYIREFSDKSAVSLREIRRFNIFYEFFYDYLNKRKQVIEQGKLDILNNDDFNFYQNLDEYSLQVYAINLSIFVCYYLRITDKGYRETMLNKLDKKFKQFNQSFNKINFIDLPLKEENFIVNNIKLDKGIAKNRALLENIFSLFVAINNKMPIFIVGKPGCSKSLSFQLLNKSMQGKSSESQFFKNYPKLMVHSYQGSMASTSKGVENLFSKARNVYQKLTAEDKKTNISIIYFDEMGLAEHSPNNPLKVIHSELEYDQNEGDKQIAFVGISNWALDASKMNRGISLSIPEPNEEDNKETSLIIGKSYNDDLAKKYKSFYENLGLVYYEYKNYLKDKHNNDGKEDFHGNRDFYHLVKNASRNMIIKENNHELNDDTLIECGINGIERNFGGLQFKDTDKKTSLEIIKNLYKKKYPNVEVKKQYNILQRIKDNINDFNSRYLLVVSKSSVSTFLLSTILSEENQEYIFYIGSKFEADLSTEEYALKILNKIQVDMENGNIIILKDLESVYPAMYDLFNQNFTVLSNKNYARLAVGSSVNTFSLVNDKFRCIVNADIEQIDNEEAPFLNRFEKHIMSFEYLLDKDLIKESENIKNTLSELVKYNEKEFKGINYDLSQLLINCNLEEIQALIYKAAQKGKKDDEITDYVLSKIALTLPQDILVNMKCNKFKEKNQKYFNKILEHYSKGEHSNFANFLKKLDNHKNAIYTFSNNLEQIKNIQNINIPKLGTTINEENISNITISSIKNENELEKQLDDFMNNDKLKICLIQLMPYEGDFMNYIKYLIENEEKKYENKPQKCFIFIVYMTRILKDDMKNIENKNDNEKKELKKKILKETLSNLSGYYQIFIDNLNGEDNLRIEKVIEMDLVNLFKNCFNPDNELCTSIFNITSYMNYNIPLQYKGLNKDNYIQKLLEFISKKEGLKYLINECLYRGAMKNNNEDLICKIFKTKNSLSRDSIDILTLIKNYTLKAYRSLLSLLFFKAEKDQFFSSLLTNEQYLEKEENNNEDEINENGLFEKISLAYLKKLDFNDGITRVTERPRANHVNIIFGLKIPGIKSIFDTITKNVRDYVSKSYRINEDNLRITIDKEKEVEEKQKYFRALNTFDNSTINIINKEKKLLNLMEENEENKEKLYNLIINDYYTLFTNINLNNLNKNEEEGQEQEKEKIIDNFDDSKTFIDLICKKRNQIIKKSLNQNENEIEPNIIKRIAQIINFVESYSEEISFLQKIFMKLNKKVLNLYKQIDNIIEQELVQYEISSRNPEYTCIINEAFFLCLDSILRVIITNDKIYDIKGEYPEDQLYSLIHIYQEILQDALQIDNNLSLRSKEALSLQEIVKIFDAFSVNKMVNIENLKEVIKYFGEETQYNNDNNSEKLCINLNNFYKFLISKLENNENKKYNFYKTLSFVFLNEYIKINNDNFREELFKIILENNDFIKNSSQIIKIMIENVIDVINPSEMIDNLDNIKNEKNKLLRKINNTKNIFLDEVVLNIFEGKINLFFDIIPDLDKDVMKEYYQKYYKDNNQKDKIKNKTGIVFDNSFEVYKQCILFLDELTIIGDNEKNNEEQNIHLSKLYAIAYVKMYLSKVVYFIKEKYKEMGNCQDIMNIIINELKNKKFGKVIKIYIFKLFYNYFNNNYEQFKYFNYKEKDIVFTDEFNDIFNLVKEEVFLRYFFLPLDDEDFTKYFEILNKLEIIKNEKFMTSTKEMDELIQKHGIPIFLNVTINKIISNLGLKNYIQDKDEYQNFCSFIKSLLNTSKHKINDKLCKLLYLFYDDKTYMENMRPKIIDENEIIDPQLFEIILYGFRFCVNTLNNDNEENIHYLYKSLLIKGYKNDVDNCYIPGIDGIEDLHLETLDCVTQHFKKYQDSNGCYVCSCGYYYSIEPCGFPTSGQKFNCPFCKQPIGYGKKVIENKGASNHGMVIRKGHYRIFRDGKQKTGQMSRWNDPDENIPNILLNQYLKEIIEPLRKKGMCGFTKISKMFFENENKKVRNLSIIGYRLLNFIAYCHLFYGYCLEYISEDNLKQCLIENMTILKIIESDWNLLKKALHQKNIDSIQIFMNMIFKKLSKLIKECKYILKKEDREEFEDIVDNLINECIKDYHNYSQIYNKENQKQLELNNYNIKTIITELVKPTEDIYPDKDYPMFKYFILTKYKTKEDFVNHMNSKEKYPLINQLLLEIPGVNKLKNLIPFNEFTNYMVDYYSFKISRDDAKKKVLENEEIFKAPEFQKKFGSFLVAWNDIKKDATKYQCRNEMPVKSLSSKDKLICFLNDNGELFNGMYLAAACQKFIEWQNSFLNPIVEANGINGILHHYVDNLKKKIPVQNAKYEQILLIDNKISNTKYYNIEDIIYSFSERNVFGEKGKINYSDYNSFVYDYDSIEEELGKIILPGVCLFQGEDVLNFITFWSEGFRGGRSDVITKFYLKYEQIDLDEKEKKIIIKYIDNLNKEKLAKNNMKYDFKEFFGSIQMIIFYLTETIVTNKKEKIINIIINAPAYFRLSDDCKNFFSNEGSNLTIDKLMNLFFYIEHLCFEDLAETLQPEYQQKLPEDKKNQIKKRLLDNYNNQLYSIKDLGAAVRRFISRYLAGKMETTDINENEELDYQLTRLELWEEKIGKNDNLNEVIKQQLGEFKLKVGEAYDFYQIIGEEDKKSIDSN